MLGILDESRVEEMRDKYVWMGPLTIIMYVRARERSSAPSTSG
jgi:hypothetical protein